MADKLKDLHFDLDAGVQTSASYTVEQAVADWMREGRDGQSPSTGLAGHLRRSHLPPDPEPRLTERHQRLSLSSADRVFAAVRALCRLRHQQEAHQPLAARLARLRAAST